MNFQIQAYEDRACGNELWKKGMKVGNQKWCTGWHKWWDFRCI